MFRTRRKVKINLSVVYQCYLCLKSLKKQRIEQVNEVKQENGFEDDKRVVILQILFENNFSNNFIPNITHGYIEFLFDRRIFSFSLVFQVMVGTKKHPISIYSLPIGRSSGQFPRRSNVLLFVLVFLYMLEV